MATMKKYQAGGKTTYTSVGNYSKADSLGKKNMSDFSSKADSVMNKFKGDSSLSKKSSSLSSDLDKMVAEKMKARTKQRSGGKTPSSPAQKKFASLAAPKDKITFADKIAGAKGKAPMAKKGTTMKKGGMMKKGC
jgi:hypothetical protein